ncbi:MAG: SEC-C metal-binding domain-containing protein, partial [Clostridium sp.]
DSPIEFLHYLKHRKTSKQNITLHLNDELDHLGLYIEHNLYYKTFENNSNSIIVPHGYRERLDVYFSSLVNKGLELQKPRQIIPVEMLKIIKFLDKSNIKEKVRLGMFLLDFSSEGREILNNAILTVLKRQQHLKRMMHITLSDETPICLFCHQQGIESISENEAKDYTFATMIHIGDKYRIELHLYYNKCNDIEDIEVEIYTVEDIPKERIEELRNMADKFSDSRIMKYKKENGTNKIGRNELCPCGTGKKYKQCHGKN